MDMGTLVTILIALVGVTTFAFARGFIASREAERRQEYAEMRHQSALSTLRVHLDDAIEGERIAKNKVWVLEQKLSDKEKRIDELTNEIASAGALLDETRDLLIESSAALAAFTPASAKEPAKEPAVAAKPKRTTKAKKETSSVTPIRKPVVEAAPATTPTTPIDNSILLATLSTTNSGYVSESCSSSSSSDSGSCGGGGGGGGGGE